ncbi:MAG: MerR family transcriptional regulator [Burkholderiaceae bacterium]|nr:MerR family transcriptional regulator [Burkholderiaceae bacterium]
MALKIGELARRTGLTVRALHHYDAIGLLTPSARSDAGYRLYSDADVARLHQIQALRSFGLALADVGTYLSRPDLSLQSVVAQQIAMLTREIEQAGVLRDRLQRLHGALAQGQEPSLADWLTTLERMNMYDKYFTPEELQQLPLYTNAAVAVPEWKALVASVQALMDRGATPQDAEAQILARHWMAKSVHDTGANPVLFARLNTLHEHNPEVRQQSGVTADILQFIIDASHEGKLAIYRRYLDDDEYAFVRANIGKRAQEWPPLIARVRLAIDEGHAPDSPQGQALARQWFELFRSFAGDNPATQAKIREALAREPGLTDPGWITAPMREWVRGAMMALPRRLA